MCVLGGRCLLRCSGWCPPHELPERAWVDSVKRGEKECVKRTKTSQTSTRSVERTFMLTAAPGLVTLLRPPFSYVCTQCKRSEQNSKVQRQQNGDLRLLAPADSRSTSETT